jgi:hypothetical protein
MFDSERVGVPPTRAAVSALRALDGGGGTRARRNGGRGRRMVIRDDSDFQTTGESHVCGGFQASAPVDPAG